VRGRHAIEWVVLAASGAAVVALGVLLVYDGLARSGDPRLQVVLEQPYQQSEAWVVPISLRNKGEAAATAVDVEVTLVKAGQQTTSSVTIGFAPGGSEIAAAVVFDQDPSGGRLQPRVLGYEVP
jgi:uncharacterized protein (TIGR02588 family)